MAEESKRRGPPGEDGEDEEEEESKVLDDDDEGPEPEEAGFPMWLMTFGDLMAILVAFFILILSFSEMDILRFRRVAEDMSVAFGVQRILTAREVPMGTSPILTYFSPGKPDPTVMAEVFQEMSELLRDAVLEKTVDIEKGQDEIIVTLNDYSLFRSGSATLLPEAIPLLAKLKAALAGISAEIRISGHTDNLENPGADVTRWDLSAARASEIANLLIESGVVKPQQVVVRGHADTRPIASEDTVEARARNRRVELHIFPVERDFGFLESESILRDLNEGDQVISPDIELDINSGREPKTSSR